MAFRFLAVTAALLIGSSADGQETAYPLETALSVLTQSPAWQASEHAVVIAQRSLEAARGAALNVNLNGEASRNAVTSATPELNGVQYGGSLGATATLAVAPWSPIFDAVRSAERGLKRAELDRLEARAGLRLDTANRYFDARSAALEAMLAQRVVSVQQQRLSVAQQQADLRTGTLEGVKAVRAALEAAQASARAATQNATLARHALFLSLGQPDREGIVFVSAPTPRTVPSLETVKLQLNAALLKRADVQRAELNVQDADDAVLIARRDRWLPQAGLNLSVGGSTASGQPTGTQAGANFNLPNGTLSVSTNYGFGTPVATQLTISLSVSLPIVAPATDARILGAQSALEAARLGLQQARGNAELDVLRSHAAADAAWQGVRVAQSNLELAQQRVGDLERRVELELSSALERDAARLSAQQAERDLATTQVNALLATWRLEVALGNEFSAIIQNGANP
jgi:outer membrane protein TolC